MTELRSVCVFCGSSPGRGAGYLAAARAMGARLAAEGIQLVYGGGQVGLMGAVADAVLESGGRAVGIIPRALWEREVGHAGLTQLHVVETMHQRKARMADLSDAFVALPGGIGTLEELFEVWTWGQLGIHRKPLGLLNVDAFYDPLLAFLDHTMEAGFLRPAHRSVVVVDHEPAPLLARLRGVDPPNFPKWLDLSRS